MTGKKVRGKNTAFRLRPAAIEIASAVLFMLIMLIMLIMLTLTGCSVKPGEGKERPDAVSTAQAETLRNAEERTEGNPAEEAPVLTETMELRYADQFSVDYYSDGSRVITVKGEEGIMVKAPVSGIYVASSASMDLFRAAGALENAAFTSTKAEDWRIDEISERVLDGEIKFIGKYNAPDFEELVNSGCSLAIENTMIYHSPETKEKLEAMGITVLMDRTSYEKHPMGRLEWVRLIGALTGHEAVAEAFFENAAAEWERVSAEAERDNAVTGAAGAKVSGTDIAGTSVTGTDAVGTASRTDNRNDNQNDDRPVIAFFSINSNGAVNIRKPGDYISKLIEAAGGRYFFDTGSDEVPDNASATMNIQFESFYDSAAGADILIYNSSKVKDLESVDELLETEPLLADFKAVRSGDVWCTGKSVFQQTSAAADMLREVHDIVRLYNEGTADETSGIKGSGTGAGADYSSDYSTDSGSYEERNSAAKEVTFSAVNASDDNTPDADFRYFRRLK